jgi:hypothetical protein
MSSPILPVEDPFGLSSPIQHTTVNAFEVRALLAEMHLGEGEQTITARRGGPPPEVLKEIAAAARVEESLRADGQQLRFRTAPDQPTAIELDEGDGERVRLLSVVEALDIASGVSPR